MSACSGSIEVWASLIIGLFIGLISSAVSWSVQKYQPSWTSTGRHDITYTHGIPGIVGAVTGTTSLSTCEELTVIVKINSTLLFSLASHLF